MNKYQKAYENGSLPEGYYYYKNGAGERKTTKFFYQDGEPIVSLEVISPVPTYEKLQEVVGLLGKEQFELEEKGEIIYDF